MELTRREMLASCMALPFVGGLEDLMTVKYATFKGIGKKNLIDPTWAESVIAVCKSDEYSDEYNGKHLIRVDRVIADNCYLPPHLAEWFTAGAETSPDHWKEDYIWYGEVRLVKDTCIMRNGKQQVDYYLCRGDKAVALRRTEDHERAC